MTVVGFGWMFQNAYVMCTVFSEALNGSANGQNIKYFSTWILKDRGRSSLTHIEMRHLVIMTGIMRILVGISLSRVTSKKKTKNVQCFLT